MKSEKAALVTGGAIRLGRAIALELAQAGYHIALHYHTSAEAAEATAAAIRQHGRQVALFSFDLSVPEACEQLLAQASARFPGLDLLVNSASRFKSGTIRESSVALFDEMIAINLRAPFLLTRLFARSREQGQIINILDTKIFSNDFDYAAYYLSKKGLAELTRMAALEFAPGIRVNAVAPGPTIPTAGTGTTDFDEATRQAIPLARTAHIDEVTRALRHLVENEFITGHILPVDGGESLCGSTFRAARSAKTA